MSRFHRFVGELVVCAAFCSWAPSALAADHDDFNVSVRGAVVLIGIALLGGLVSWIAKVRAGLATPSLTQLVGELCTSSFSGFLCYLICDSYGVPFKLTVAATGIAGHMGTRAIVAGEKYLARKTIALAGASLDDEGKESHDHR